MRAYFYLIVATLCWGANTIFGRMAVGEVSPMVVVSGRWLGVVLILAIYARNEIKHDWPILKQHWRYLTLMGASGYALFNGFYYVAAHTTSAVNMGIIQGSIPVFVLIGAFVAYRIQTSLLQMLGILSTLIGVVIVTARGDLQHLIALVFTQGDVLMIIACFLYAVYALGLKRRPDVSSLSLFTGMAMAAFLISIPMLAGEALLGQLLLPSLNGWLIIGLITLLPSLLAQILFIRGVEIIGPGRAGVFINMVPIFSAILAVLVLGEHFKAYHALALGLVLGGIALSEKGKPT